MQISDYAQSSAPESELSEPEPDVDELASEDEVSPYARALRVFCAPIASGTSLTRAFSLNFRV